MNSTLSFWATIDGQMYEFLGVTRALSYTLKKTVDLLTGTKSDGGVEALKKELSSVSIGDSFQSQNKKLKVIHLFYELGSVLDPRVSCTVTDSEQLGILMEFSDKKVFEASEKTKEIEIESINGPSKEDYFKVFEKGLYHLKRGDCYQYNLTFPFMINFTNTSLENFLSHFWSNTSLTGRYSSVTKLQDSEQVYFSNSPECLFNIKRKDEKFFIESLPIKGTQNTINQTVEEAWAILSKSEKDQSELYMITDLMRNDLSKLSGQWAQVISKKEKMIVPGLVHSYSHLETEVFEETSLLEIVECLFPGGSITGAPKIRVMEIIDSLEEEPRGFYCGSTIIATEGHLSGSINIRSGVLNPEAGEMKYHSGGGITFKSSPDLEYREMWDKVQSFTNVLAPHQKKKSINSVI